MNRKQIVILPVATALASLTGAANASTPADPSTDVVTTSDAQTASAKIEPNALVKAGQDLLGLLVTKRSDGTVVAQHSSHFSHSSHASHASHASSRF